MVASGLGFASTADAFDFFGLWPGDDAPPAVSRQAIPYVVTFTVEGGDSGLINALRDASALYALRADVPPDGLSLARRAARDFAPMVDSLWASGYFEAKLTISIDETPLPVVGDAAAFARAAEGYRNREPAPVTVMVVPGERFRLRSVVVLGSDGRTPLPPSELPARIVGLGAGEPAAAESVRAAEARMVDFYRAKSHPLAKVTAVRPVVDHPARAMDVAITLDPGPVAGIGAITVKTPDSIPEAVIRSFVYVDKGDPYSPAALERDKTSVRSIPAVGAARFVEGTTLDAVGDLPLQLNVDGRPQHALGATAQYSTIDGPVGQLYWENRNLFGAAEFLRLQADLLYAPSKRSVASVGPLANSDLGGRLSAHFMKPALGGSRNDLLIDASAERASTSFGNFVGYNVNDVDLDAAIRHRFSEALSMQAGVEARKGIATDTLGSVNYTLLGLPVSVNYDTTDDRLDPTQGLRGAVRAATYPRLLGSSLNLAVWRATVSGYQALDEASRYVLAARLSVGGQMGAPLNAIPADMRFYAGGSGSVRGFQYYSLGPTAPGGAVIGGRSLFESSLEMRMRVTDTIGIVPFVDAGNAYASRSPNFSTPPLVSTGLGLRYYTSFGPIRLDVAAPVVRRKGDARFVVYVGIGQAF